MTKTMKMKNRLVVAAVAGLMALSSAQAGLSKSQIATINKQFTSLSRAEFAAKATELVSAAKAAEKVDTAVAAVKASIAKSPATAPVVVGAVAQVYPECAPAVASAAAKLAPNQADAIAKAAAQAAPAQAEKVMLAVVQAAPKSIKVVAEAVINSVPSVVKNSSVIRSRNQQSNADGPPVIITSNFRITSWNVDPNGNLVFVQVDPFPAGNPTDAGPTTPGGDPYGRP